MFFYKTVLGKKILSTIIVMVLCVTGMNVPAGKELKGNTNVSVIDEIKRTKLSEKKLTDISEIALRDGEKAANKINAYDDYVDYEAALNFALSAYYKSGNFKELESFKASIDNRAKEMVKGYELAAKERKQGISNGYIPGEAIVMFDEGCSEEEIKSVVEAEYGQCNEMIKLFNGQTMAVVSISLGQTVDMAIDSYGEYNAINIVDYNSIDQVSGYSDINDNQVNNQYYLDYINAAGAWDFVSNTQHEKILVGVIDTGIELNHPELVNMISPNSADVTGESPVLLSEMEQSYVGQHGTFVSGIIAAEANNDSMMAGVASCYNNDVVEILAVQAAYHNEEKNTQYFTQEDQIKAIDYCVEQNVKVINMSLAGAGHDSAIAAVLQSARKAGVITVVAAGNNSSEATYFPSDSIDTISVIATDENNDATSFTNYGIKKDICAPGINILSTTLGGETTVSYGTSFSSPIVAAVVAMMCSVNGNLDFYDVRQILSDTSVDIGIGNKCRNGLVNAYEAVKMAYDFTDENRTKINLAENKTVILSEGASLDEETYPVSNLVDGDEGTDWISSTETNKTITIDLESECVIDEIELQFNNVFSSYFQTFVSVDGEAWCEYTKLTTASAVDAKTVDTDVTRARYIKFVFNYSQSVGYEEIYVWGYEKQSNVGKEQEIEFAEPTIDYSISESKILTLNINSTEEQLFYKYNIYVNGELVSEEISKSATILLTDKGYDEEFELKVTSLYRNKESEGVTYTLKMPGEHQVLEPLGAQVEDLGNNTLQVSWISDYVRISNNYKYNVYINGELYIEKTGVGSYVIENVPSGNIQVKVTSIYKDAESEGVTFDLYIEKPTNELEELAIGKSAYSSSKEGEAYVADFAIDGNSNTRWASLSTDEEWIYVDLENVYSVSKVVLNWEAAYGKSYKIQLSDNGTYWKTVASEISSDGGEDVIEFEALDARYVKIVGVERATGYGYSVWDFEVYGGTATGNIIEEETEDNTSGGVDSDNNENEETILDVNLAAQKLATASSREGDNVAEGNAFDTNKGTRWSSQFNDEEWIYVDLEQEYLINKVVLNWEGAYGKDYNIDVSIDGEEWTTVCELRNQNGGEDEIYFDSANARYVRMTGIARGTGYGYSLWEMEVYCNQITTEDNETGDIGSEDQNKEEHTSELLSLGKYTISSSNESEGMNSSLAVDGNVNSRWASSWTDNEWVYVDLGDIYTIDKVILNWEGAYGKDYNIDISTDGEEWITISELRNQDGGIDEILVDNVNARYVRMTGIARGTGYGYSLWEMSVYGY